VRAHTKGGNGALDGGCGGSLRVARCEGSSIRAVGQMEKSTKKAFLHAWQGLVERLESGRGVRTLCLDLKFRTAIEYLTDALCDGFGIGKSAETLDCGGLKLDIRFYRMGSHPVSRP